MTVAAAGVSILVIGSFIVLSIEDATTSRVTIQRSRAATAIAVIGFFATSSIGGSWDRLLNAALGAMMVTAALAIPYLVQAAAGRRRRREPQRETWIGRADVRLSVPFGWTLGWFDVRAAAAGLAVALAAGVLAAIGTHRSTVPFVPYLTLGLIVGIGWGLWDLLR